MKILRDRDTGEVIGRAPEGTPEGVARLYLGTKRYDVEEMGEPEADGVMFSPSTLDAFVSHPTYTWDDVRPFTEDDLDHGLTRQIQDLLLERLEGIRWQALAGRPGPPVQGWSNPGDYDPLEDLRDALQGRPACSRCGGPCFTSGADVCGMCLSMEWLANVTEIQVSNAQQYLQGYLQGVMGTSPTTLDECGPFPPPMPVHGLYCRLSDGRAGTGRYAVQREIPLGGFITIKGKEAYYTLSKAKAVASAVELVHDCATRVVDRNLRKVMWPEDAKGERY